MKTTAEIAAGYDAIAEHIFESPSLYEDSFALAPDVRDDVLEVGCGQGHFLSLLAARSNCGLYGCDVSPRLIQMAQLKVPAANLTVCDALDLAPYPDQRFSFVFHLCVLEHLVEHARALRAVRRVLKPEGTLILVVPNRDWLRYDRWASLHTQEQPIDDYFFRVKEISGLLAETGFRITRTRGVWAMIWADWRHRWEMRLADSMPALGLHHRMKCVGLRCELMPVRSDSR